MDGKTFFEFEQRTEDGIILPSFRLSAQPRYFGFKMNGTGYAPLDMLVRALHDDSFFSAAVQGLNGRASIEFSGTLLDYDGAEKDGEYLLVPVIRPGGKVVCQRLPPSGIVPGTKDRNLAVNPETGLPDRTVQRGESYIMSKFGNVMFQRGEPGFGLCFAVIDYWYSRLSRNARSYDRKEGVLARMPELAQPKVLERSFDICAHMVPDANYIGSFGREFSELP